jgi:hypothetical protein
LKRSSDLPDRSRIARELRVARQERDALDERLGDQQTIERILVQRRKRVDADRVLAGDRQLGVAVVKEAATEQARLDAEIVTSQAV